MCSTNRCPFILHLQIYSKQGELNWYIFISTLTFSLSYTGLEIRCFATFPIAPDIFFFMRLFFEAITNVAKSLSHGWCSALEAFIMVDYLTCVPSGPNSEKLTYEGVRCGNLWNHPLVQCLLEFICVIKHSITKVISKIINKVACGS